MKCFGRKSRILVCATLVLAFVLAPVSVFAGYHREWTRVRDWNRVLDAYEEDRNVINVGAEGKLTIECWEEAYPTNDAAAVTAPYQLQLVQVTGTADYEQTFTVTVSDDGSSSYHRTFALTGLPKGDYQVTVKPQAKVRFHFRADTYRNVYSEPTYKEMTTLAKSLATKNIQYKNEDIGEHARLYGKKVDTGLFLSRGEDSIMGSTFQPYIDIQKNGKTAKLSLRIKGTAKCMDYYGDYLGYDSIRFYTSNRTTTFDIGYDDARTGYSYKYDLYTCTNYWSATLSSNTTRRTAQIDKLIKILKQKKVKVKIFASEDSNFIWCELTDSQRKNWLAVVQKYKKMLKEYA